MTDNKKSWLARPDGKVGVVLPIVMMVALGGTGFYYWGLILPFLIAALTNTILLVILAAVLGVMLVGLYTFLFDDRWRNLAFYLYKSAVRKATSLVIEMDPVNILKTYVSSLREKLQAMDEAIKNLYGQILKISDQIEKNAAARHRSLEIAQQAFKNPDMKATFTRESRQADRLEKSNARLQATLDPMMVLLERMKKYREASSLMIMEIEDDVQVKISERNAVLAGHNAFNSAKRILEGGDDQREIFDMTMEKMTEDYSMKMGEIDTYLDLSKSFIDAVDLDSDIANEKALKLFEEWEKNSKVSSNVRVGPNVRVSRDAAPNSNDFAAFYDDDDNLRLKH